MKGQPKERSASTTARKGHEIRLLLVGREEEFQSRAVARRSFNEHRFRITGRSASLLGALERLQPQAIDIVLLSSKFQNEELALFTADARRNGFDGLILRAVSPIAFMESYGGQQAGIAPKGAFPSIRAADGSSPSTRLPLDSRRREERESIGTPLTHRQREVLTRVSEGSSNGQIAQELQCSESGVKATLQELFKKLGVRKRSLLVRMAIEKGIVESEHPVPARSAAGEELEYTEPVYAGDFVIDPVMHRVWIRGAETHLTPNEFELLTVFLRHPGELVRSSSLREMFWRNPTAKHAVLRVLIGSLRSKIEISKVPQYLVTERNLGYRFSPAPRRAGGSDNRAPRSSTAIGGLDHG